MGGRIAGAPPPRSGRGGGARLRVSCARMLRISWPLALVLAACIAVVARRPRLIGYVALVFAIWWVVQTARNRRG